MIRAARNHRTQRSASVTQERRHGSMQMPIRSRMILRPSSENGLRRLRRRDRRRVSHSEKRRVPCLSPNGLGRSIETSTAKPLGTVGVLAQELEQPTRFVCFAWERLACGNYVPILVSTDSKRLGSYFRVVGVTSPFHSECQLSVRRRLVRRGPGRPPIVGRLRVKA